MQQVIFLIVAAVIGVVVFRLRSAAAGERKAVMARLADEREARGDYSPTAELFREAGVTVGAGSVAPPFVPTFERLSDLRHDDHPEDPGAASGLADEAEDDDDLLGGLGIAALDLSPSGDALLPADDLLADPSDDTDHRDDADRDDADGGIADLPVTDLATDDLATDGPADWGRDESWDDMATDEMTADDTTADGTGLDLEMTGPEPEAELPEPDAEAEVEAEVEPEAEAAAEAEAEAEAEAAAAAALDAAAGPETEFDAELQPELQETGTAFEPELHQPEDHQPEDREAEMHEAAAGVHVPEPEPGPQPAAIPEPVMAVPAAARTGADLARALLDGASLDDEPAAALPPRRTVAPAPVPPTTAAPAPEHDAAELDDLPAPVGPPVGDLRTLYRGLQMPAGLTPLGPLEPTQATFVTAALPAVVRAALADEFDRLGCDTAWVETDVARTERNGQRGLVMIHPNADTSRDPEGRLLFAGVAPGSVVVRMLAL